MCFWLPQLLGARGLHGDVAQRTAQGGPVGGLHRWQSKTQSLGRCCSLTRARCKGLACCLKAQGTVPMVEASRHRGGAAWALSEYADPATYVCDQAIAIADPSSIVCRCGCDQRAQDAALRGRRPAGCLGDRFIHRLEKPRAPHLGGLRRHLGTNCVCNFTIVYARPLAVASTALQRAC